MPDGLVPVIAQLADGAREVFGVQLVGLYLVGSFALGAGDEHSDVDFIAAVTDDPTEADVRALETLHARLFALPSVWAPHLEGSYIPVDALRAKVAEPRPFVFFDNGAVTAVRDEHDDTHVLRWVLRERGIPVLGPDPRTLVDPVTADQLRDECGPMLDSYAAWAPEHSPVGRMSRWKQPYLVATVCRILFTWEEGTVPSKPEALAWGLTHLPARFVPLFEQAMADRPDPWRRVHEAADDRLVDETLALVAWAVAEGRMTGPGSNGEVAAIVRQLSWVLDQVIVCLDDLTDAELGWRPPIAESNDARTIASHILGSTAAYALGLGLGQQVIRDRFAEFHADHADRVALLGDLQDLSRDLWLTTARTHDLDAAVTVPEGWVGPAATGTRRDALLEAIRHASIHLGELRLVRDMARSR
jgi:hypothetical protein